MNTIKAVIFDMNGVLVNDEHLHIQSIHDTAKEYGLDIPPELNEALCMGRTDHEGILNIKKHFKSDFDPAEFLEKRLKRYHELAEKELTSLNNAKTVVESLQDSFVIALTTSSSKSIVDFTLQQLGIKDQFKVIVTADDITNGKPDPEPYLLTASKLELNPKECVVIEDTKNGIASAKGAGMWCIGITSTNPVERLSQADLIINALGEIPQAIERISRSA